LESSIPPSTPCSAATSCGGVRSSEGASLLVDERGPRSMLATEMSAPT